MSEQYPGGAGRGLSTELTSVPPSANESPVPETAGSNGQIQQCGFDEMLREAKQLVTQAWNDGTPFSLSSMKPADRESFAAGILTGRLRAETADDCKAIAEMYGVIPDAEALQP